MSASASQVLVLRNRDFGRLWLGQILNQAGQRVYEIAMVWWVLSHAGDSGGGLYVGTLLVVGALPALLFFRAIGRFVDRTRSRHILVGSDWLAALLLATVAQLLLSGSLPLFGAYVAGFALATLQAVVNPTLNKAIPETVSREDTEGAVTFQTSTQALASFGGAALGAVLIDFVGIGGVAWVTALAYVASSICNAGIRFRRPANSTSSVEGEETPETGWQVVRRHPLILRVLLASGAINFFSVPTLVILPLYVKNVFVGGPSLLSLLEAALWLGLVVGAGLAPRIRYGGRYPGSISRLGFSCLSILGLGLLFPGLVIAPAAYLAALAIAGGALGVNNVKFVAYFHGEIDDEVKGRFFALLQALISFTFPLGYFLFGVLAEPFAPNSLCIIQGLGIVGVACYFLTLRRFEATT